MMVERRGPQLALSGYRRAVRGFCWTFDLDDDNGDPSVLKLMAVAFASVSCWAGFKFYATLAIGMGFLAVCTALGYKGAKLFAAWKGISLEDRRSDVRKAVDVVVHTQESGHTFAVADPAAG